jgi:nucleotide-binding universal stress UspA family protein
MRGIVVGVDGSAHALDALRFAIEESRYRNCALLVVETWQVPYYSSRKS